MKNTFKFKVNYVNDLFWLAPNFSSYFHMFSYGYKPFKSLFDLVKINNLTDTNGYFSFNALNAKNYDFFNTLYNIKKLSFRINKEVLYKIENQGFVEDYCCDQNLCIIWDKKSLKWIQKGYLPFYNKEYLINQFCKNEQVVKITWEKKKFITVEDTVAK
ncbi:MAG: hypothetical protein HUJ42_03760 [Malacoplasma sp.]|nr:hypothetical protein [Malacoplasma sp.]